LSFEVLRASEPSERAKWIEAWEQWPDREPMWHPSYAELFAGADDLRCVSFSDERGVAFMPILLRSLSDLEWARESDLTDASTPYGYGGPAKIGNPNSDAFWDAFDEWARSARLVSFVERISLFSDQILPFRGEVETVMQNVVRTLQIPQEEMWMDYEHKVRKNINKAQRSGLTVEVDPAGKGLDDFMRIYTQTMERRSAGEQFFLSREKIAGVDRGLTVFFHTLMDGKVVSSEIVLVGAKHIYSFLGGTDSEAFEFRPNDLLKHEIINWGRANGKEAFVLGGGFGGNDGIFRYKLSFAPEGARDFRIGKRVLDEVRYKELCEMRECFERKRNPEWQPRENYFPVYRG